MYLRAIAPPRFDLRRWVQSSMQPRTWFVLDDPDGTAGIRQSERAVARTPLVQVFDLLNIDDNIVGALVRHRPMAVSVGTHYLSLGNVPEAEQVKVSHWQGEYITLLEGPNGATLFHHCEVVCRTSNVLQAL